MSSFKHFLPLTTSTASGHTHWPTAGSHRETPVVLHVQAAWAQTNTHSHRQHKSPWDSLPWANEELERTRTALLGFTSWEWLTGRPRGQKMHTHRNTTLTRTDACSAKIHAQTLAHPWNQILLLIDTTLFVPQLCTPKQTYRTACTYVQFYPEISFEANANKSNWLTLGVHPILCRFTKICVLKDHSFNKK